MDTASRNGMMWGAVTAAVTLVATYFTQHCDGISVSDFTMKVVLPSAMAWVAKRSSARSLGPSAPASNTTAK